MNPTYLNTFPEVPNEYNICLEDDEKVIFTSELNVFGDEKDQVLGSMGSKFTLTNKKIVADNGPGIWTIDLLDDISSWKKVIEPKRFFFPESVYFLVMLNDDIVFDDGKRSLRGFHFYFDKAKTLQLEGIVNQLQD